MKCLRWFYLAVVVALVAILMPFSVSAASPSIDDIKVFQGYQETDDWLIVCTLNISGSNTSTSLCDLYSNLWYIQLIYNPTATAVTTNQLMQCGMRPASIYISAASAVALTWAGNYSVKIYGGWGTTPNTSRAINAADWKSTDLVILDNWAIYQAKLMQTYDSVDYVGVVPEYNEVLTVSGGNIFDTGIPYLSTYRPNKFIITTEKVSVQYENYSGSTNYADTLYAQTVTDTFGADIATAVDNVAPYFGFSGANKDKALMAVLILCGFFALATINIVLAFPIILAGVLVGVFPMGTVLLIVFIAIILLIRGLFWSST
jgi:hypothetical protein